MHVDRKIIFDAVKAIRGGQPWTQPEVNQLDAAINAAVAETTPVPLDLQRPVARPLFRLSTASAAKLEIVKPALASTVKLAIGYSPVDFKVNQSLRTVEQQKTAVAEGHSRTMHSKHLVQPDGYVWAVDLVTLVDGVVSWEFNRYAGIAWAMDKAATELGYAAHIRWGCAWDRVLADFAGDVKSYLAEAKAYADRHAGSDLLDAPHFEWVS